MTISTRLGFVLAIFGGLLAVAPQLSEAYLLVKLLCLSAGAALIWLGLLGKPVPRTALDRPLFAFWLALLLSAAGSADPPTSVFGAYPQAFYGVVQFALYTALYYGAAAVAGDGDSSDELLRWMLAAAIPLSVYGIAQRFFGDVLTGFPLPTNRITSTIGNPIMLGSCLVALFPLALHAALERKSRLGTAALAAVSVALVMTWARGAWLSAAAAAALYLWLTGRLIVRPRHVAIVVVLSPFMFFAAQRVMNKGDSDALRIETIKSSLSAYAAHPLLGVGPDNFLIPFRRYKTDRFLRVAHGTVPIQFSAHNDLLQVAVTLGAAGLLAYVWLLCVLGMKLRAELPDSAHAGRTAAVAAAFLGIFIQAKVNPIHASVMALAAILAGIVCRERAALPPRVGRAAAALAAALCAACVFLYGRFCAADYKYMTGWTTIVKTEPKLPAFMDGVNNLRLATELNPWLLEYLSKRCEVIDRVSTITSPEQGRQLIDKSLQLTEEGIRLHPGNPMAHELRATALALSARFGSKRLPEALAEIKTASTLDPTSVFTLRRRMDIDRSLGDREDFERTRVDYLRVIRLTGEDPNWVPLVF